MWPVVAIAAASAIGQYMNSQAAREASAAERARLEAIFNKLQAPDLDSKPLTPEEYKVVRDYVPEAAPLILEAQPQLIQQTGDMEMGRQAQRNALRRMSGIGEGEFDPEFAALQNQAARRSQEEAQSRQASIMQDAARRGVGGSGLALAMQGQAAADAMRGGAEASQQAAAQAYKNRIQALMNGAQLGSQMRGEDVQLQGRNADIINAFNQRTSQAAQNWANQRANIGNEAQRFNIGAAQDVANRNVGLRNTTAAANQAARNDAAQRDFENQMSIARGQAGLSDAARSDIRQNAADQNAAIQGVTNAGMAGFQYYGQQKAQEAAEDREDRRLRYQQTGVWE